MNNNGNQRSEFGALGLLFAVAVLGFFAAFLQDTKGVSYENLGALVWIGATLIAFVLGLLYFAQFVLPLQGQDDWALGFELLVRFYGKLTERFIAPTSRPDSQRRSGPRRRGEKSKRAQRKTAVLPSSFTEVSGGMVLGHQVLSLLKGGGFSRAAGPGFVQLFKGERVDKIIDLRTQKREQQVEGTTRDGISIKTAVYVFFRVQQIGSDVTNRRLYPYDKEAIFRVSNYNSQDTNGIPRYWDDQLAPFVAAELSHELATYNVDELQHTVGQYSVRSEIKQRIQRKASREAARHGIELLDIEFALFTYPQEIIEQRIKTWQAEWQRQIQIHLATGDAEAARLIKQARARAQIEIIERITQSIDAMRQQDDTNLTEIITLRMIEALEEATSNDSVRALIPHQVMTSLVMDASNQMQLWLSRRSEDETS
ncbi:MAG: hypothetical protein KC419_15545 [Anaerolineales bacterium]|nr:hypothetical protein [Anaerolineales bacterium]MCA9929898.1 hypothetical protein [Anaerolineales bacterium]